MTQADSFTTKDKEIKDNEKYLLISENKIAGQYIVQFTNEFLTPSMPSENQAVAKLRDATAKSATDRRQKSEAKILPLRSPSVSLPKTCCICTPRHLPASPPA